MGGLRFHVETLQWLEELRELLARRSDVAQNGPSSEQGQEWLARVSAVLWQIDVALATQFDQWGRALQLNLPSYTTEPIWNQVILSIRSVIVRLERETHAAATNLDAVTRLRSREAFTRDLDRFVGECREARVPLALIVLDIDSFKRINDELGHDVGDQALSAVAGEMSKIVRGKGGAYRYGGEELMVILQNASLQEALPVAERIRAGIEALRLEPIGRQITVSAGVAEFPSNAPDTASLFREADQAMYRAKHAGRNRVVAASDPGLKAAQRAGRSPENEEVFQSWAGLARASNSRGYWLSVVVGFAGDAASFETSEKRVLVETVASAFGLPSGELEISGDREQIDIAYPKQSPDKDFIARFNRCGVASVQEVGVERAIPAQWVLSKAYSALRCLRDERVISVFPHRTNIDLIICLSNWPESGVDPQDLVPPPVKAFPGNLRGRILCEPYLMVADSDPLVIVAQFGFAMLGESGLWDYEEPLKRLTDSREDFRQYLEQE